MVSALGCLPPSSQAYVSQPASATTHCKNVRELVNSTSKVTMLTRLVVLQHSHPQV